MPARCLANGSSGFQIDDQFIIRRRKILLPTFQQILFQRHDEATPEADTLGIDDLGRCNFIPHQSRVMGLRMAVGLLNGASFTFN